MHIKLNIYQKLVFLILQYQIIYKMLGIFAKFYQSQLSTSSFMTGSDVAWVL